MFQKLKSTVISKVQFEDTPLSDAIAYLASEGRKMDPQGCLGNFVLELDHARAKKITVHLDLKNTPLLQVIHFLAQASNLDCQIDSYAVVLTDQLRQHANPPDPKEQFPRQEAR